MTPKLQKINTELDKARTRLTETQERICELERQKTELENTEIIALFRSLNVASDELPAFIAAMKTAALPQAEPAVTAPAVSGSHTFGYGPNEEDEYEN